MHYLVMHFVVCYSGTQVFPNIYSRWEQQLFSINNIEAGNQPDTNKSIQNKQYWFQCPTVIQNSSHNKQSKHHSLTSYRLQRSAGNTSPYILPHTQPHIRLDSQLRSSCNWFVNVISVTLHNVA